MKVVLVNVRMEDRRLPPLGLAYVAAYLRSKGVEVDIIDPTPRQLLHGFDYVDRVLSMSPDMVGFNASAVNAEKVMGIAKDLKSRDPSVKVVLGGPQATAMPEDMLIDYVVMGEGEITMHDLAMVIDGKKREKDVPGILYRAGKKARRNGGRSFINDLDVLPLPARDLLPLNWYFQRDSIIRGYWGRGTSVLWSRGCPYNCLFCTSRETFGRTLRLRSPARIVDEIELLRGKYNLRHFYVLDDILNVNKKWTQDVCEELVERDLDIKWSCQIRVNLVTRELLRSMKRAGCVEVEYGCESGSQKVLNTIRKGIAVQQTIDAFKLSREAGIDTMAYFMIGNPTETMEDIDKTIKLAETINADYYEFSISTPYPGSDLWKLAKMEGWLKSEDYSTAFHTGDRANPIMEANFSGEELLRIKKDLFGRFKSKYFIKFMKQPAFAMDLAGTLISSPRTLLSCLSHAYRGDLQGAAWKFFHQQRLKE